MSELSAGIASALKIVENDKRRRRPKWVPPSGQKIKQMRSALGLTQEAFADRFGLDLESLRKWEQDKVTPEQVSCMILQMIEQDGDTLEALVAKVKAANDRLVSV